MARIMPDRKLLSIWRIYLTVSALIPAFILSVVFRIMSGAWIIATAVWVVCFVLLYALYFPLLFKQKSYCVEREKVTSFGGFAYRYSHTLPVGNIQYVLLIADPLERMFGLCSLAVVAAGGRMVIQGLVRADGEKLMSVLSGEN